jgi:hypothetical protein
VRQVAEVADKATGGEAARQVQALKSFAEFIKSCRLDDPPIAALYRIAAQMGDGNSFNPGEKRGAVGESVGAGYSRAPARYALENAREE